MTLREGLMYSRNSITAQVMQTVGPPHVARLARAMGVRDSELDEVPSLALGTSPVTLREMVASYSTIADEGRYREPLMILQVDNRDGKVLEAFAPEPPETALSEAVAHTLLDAMRGVINQGTGVAIRSRYGINADVAGKTGTTQDNTDGWFILMHPQLVAGAWVGFNDNRVTMGDGWGQGARSALPMVGDFFQHALRARVVDSKARFAAPPSAGGGWEPGGAGDPGDAGQTDPLLDLANELLKGEPQPDPLPGSEPLPESAAGGVPGEAAQGQTPPAPLIREIPTQQSPETDPQVPADLQGPQAQPIRRWDSPEPQR
jgi:penicillin-binding protein 1A